MPLVTLGSREMAFEAGLHRLKRIPKRNQERRRLLSRSLLNLSEAVRVLSRKDLAILEAVTEQGSISAAAAVLAPDRPGYRSYIQKRFKYFEQLAARLADSLRVLMRAENEL